LSDEQSYKTALRASKSISSGFWNRHVDDHAFLFSSFFMILPGFFLNVPHVKISWQNVKTLPVTEKVQ
jgi:hypothetical protein